MGICYLCGEAIFENPSVLDILPFAIAPMLHDNDDLDNDHEAQSFGEYQ